MVSGLWLVVDMKLRTIFIIWFLVLGSGFLATPVNAVCRDNGGNPVCPAGQAHQTYFLEFPKCGDSTNPFQSCSPQCTHPIYDSGTTAHVCCDGNGDPEAAKVEANSVDSVRAPLCGASVELGEGNSVCWGCGGYFYCSGAAFALGGMDPELEAHRNASFEFLTESELNAIKSRGSFNYNGHNYAVPQDLSAIGMCSSNVKACLTPDFNSCINLATNTYSTTPAPPPAAIKEEGDLVNEVMDLSQSQSFVIRTIVQDPAPPGGALPPPREQISYKDSLAFSFAGQWLTDNQKMDTPLRAKQDGEWLGRVNKQGRLTLTPYALKQPGVYMPFLTKQSASMKSRLCVTNPETGEVYQIESPDIINSQPVEYLNTISEHGRGLNSFLNPLAPLPDQKFDLPAKIIAAAKPCDVEAVGTNQNRNNKNTAGANSFGQKANPVVQFTMKITDAIIAAFTGGGSNGNVTSPAYLKTTIKTPYSEHACNVGECRISDLQYSPISNEEKNALQARSGFVTAFIKPYALNYADDTHGQLKNDYHETFYDTYPKKDTRFQVTERLKDSTDFLKCASTPFALSQSLPECKIDWTAIAAKPLENLLPINTSDWAIAGVSTNPISTEFNKSQFSGDVGLAIEQATAGKIPACVLEGVKWIETGDGWDGSRCRVNSCSAAGPFQITTGKDANGNAACPGCNSSWVAKNGCPNTWGNRPGDPCDPFASAIAAVEILIGKAEFWTERIFGVVKPLSAGNPTSQRDAIITAGNAYYGGAASIPRLGDCSYGEFVYKHCDASYQCGSTNVILK